MLIWWAMSTLTEGKQSFGEITCHQLQCWSHTESQTTCKRPYHHEIFTSHTAFICHVKHIVMLQPLITMCQPKGMHRQLRQNKICLTLPAELFILPYIYIYIFRKAAFYVNRPKNWQVYTEFCSDATITYQEYAITYIRSIPRSVTQPM